MTARLAVGDAIDVDLDRVLKKTIDEHRTVRRYLNRACHVTSQVRFHVNQLHRASAQNEAWPNEHRIANFPRYPYGLFGACGRSVWRLAQAESVQHRRE